MAEVTQEQRAAFQMFAATSGMWNNPSQKVSGAWADSYKLRSALGADGQWYRGQALVRVEDPKIVVTKENKIYCMIEGTLLACGPGLQGSLKVKEKTKTEPAEYSQVAVSPGMSVSVSQLWQMQATEGLIKALHCSLMGMTPEQYNATGEAFLAAVPAAIWMEKKLIGQVLFIDLLPKLKKDSDAFNREEGDTHHHNFTITAGYEQWRDLSQPPMPIDWEARWPAEDLLGAPLSGETVPAATVARPTIPAPVARPTIPAATAPATAPATVARPTIPAATAPATAPATVARPTVPAATAPATAPATVARPTVPAPVARPTVPAATAPATAPATVARPTVPAKPPTRR